MDGTVDFHKTWKDYEIGFGDLKSEFWLGNFLFKIQIDTFSFQHSYVVTLTLVSFFVSYHTLMEKKFKLFFIRIITISAVTTERRKIPKGNKKHN